jgi:hypothetical protein
MALSSLRHETHVILNRFVADGSMHVEHLVNCCPCGAWEDVCSKLPYGDDLTHVAYHLVQHLQSNIPSAGHTSPADVRLRAPQPIYQGCIMWTGRLGG